jgi:hypothetical protein
MSIPTLHEPLALVEFDHNLEKENSTDEAKYAAMRAIIEMMHNEKMVLPVLAAMLTSNGGGSLYHYEEYGEANVLAEYEGSGRLFPDSFPLD